MRKLRKKAAILLIFAMVTIFGMTVLASEDVTVPEESEEMLIAGASESDLSDYDEALGYVEAYDENVASDADFDSNLATALTTVRGEVKAYGTVIALIPPLIAIVLALITKEVYFSLFLGILSGSLIYTMFHPVLTVTKTFDVIINKLADGWNVGILIFLVILGIMVSMINKAGGSAAYGEWASKKISSRMAASLATFLLGALIFVDDYFNCLTVGSVMRPVTDKEKISRAKLAYLIDATAAPICIIAPISSWAAAVTSVAPEGEGFKLFISSIPYNFYALLTIVMIITISLMKFDYGPMKKHEDNALKGDLFTSGADDFPRENAPVGKKGSILDLILPVIVLIVCCIIGMIYTGGFFEGENFMNAFANSDASVGLVLGSFIALVFTMLFFLLRKRLSFKEISNSLTEGFKAMVPAIMILTFAWSLGGITMDLGAKVCVAEFVRGNAANLTWLLPAIVFLIALGLAFATGTSWGTFGILLPIVCAVFSTGDPLMTISISACLAGAVCGDHCSPISDTTIMASAGANCNHINHVTTQLPYALTVAAVSFVTFIIAGLVKTAFIALPIGIVLMVGTLVVIRIITKEKSVKTAGEE
ncbi:MAG: Na+/H+ antiporter NhaC family protein [Lachnospiraceae bacterium]|nr:Na+/H+ antiporter NhaC family protein [Lachnospiraceae bacterium]